MMTTWHLQYYYIVTLSPADRPATTPTTKGQESCSQAVLGATMAQRGEEKSMGTRTRSRS